MRDEAAHHTKPQTLFTIDWPNNGGFKL